jgi:hypothetical protein
MSNQKSHRSANDELEDPFLRAELTKAARFLMDLYLWEAAHRRSENDQEDAPEGH